MLVIQQTADWPIVIHGWMYDMYGMAGVRQSSMIDISVIICCAVTKFATFLVTQF